MYVGIEEELLFVKRLIRDQGIERVCESNLISVAFINNRRHLKVYMHRVYYLCFAFDVS